MERAIQHFSPVSKSTLNDKWREQHKPNNRGTRNVGSRRQFSLRPNPHIDSGSVLHPFIWKQKTCPSTPKPNSPRDGHVHYPFKDPKETQKSEISYSSVYNIVPFTSQDYTVPARDFTLLLVVTPCMMKIFFLFQKFQQRYLCLFSWCSAVV